MKERENADGAQRIKATDYSLYQNQEKLAELQKTAEARDFDLRRTTEALDNSQADLCRARDEQARLQQEQCELTRQLDAKLAEKADLARRSEIELSRNRDFTANLYDLEGKHRNADDNLAVSRRE